MNPLQESERLLEAALATPGLLPRWSRGAPPDGPTFDLPALARQPAAEWPAPLLALWRAGSVFLIDEKSRVAGPIELAARRLVIRESSIGAFSSLTGDGILVDRCVLKNHVSLEGPVALVTTVVHQYVLLGPVVVAIGSAFQAFSKAQRGIRVDRSLVGSHTAIDGGNHPEKIPLGPQRRVLGARVGPDAWIGQHVSITAGASIGAGVVVAPHTAVSGVVSDHVMLAGSPARPHPVDFNIRGLSPDEARREGREQGSVAVDLPIYGRQHRGALRDPRCLEVDYAEHGALRGLASENLVHFQAGVLESVLAQLFPDHHAEVSFVVGATVRFVARFDRPLSRDLAFRRSPPSGMLGISLDPPALQRLWDLLASWDAPPLPEVTTAAPVAPPAAKVTSDGTLDLVAAMLAEALGTKVKIDVDAPFYAIGVDSLTAADLATRIEQTFKIEPPDVFANNTVRLLAQAVDTCRRA